MAICWLQSVGESKTSLSELLRFVLIVIPQMGFTTLRHKLLKGGKSSNCNNNNIYQKKKKTHPEVARALESFPCIVC